MNGEDLFRGLGYVSPEYIAEAETVTRLEAGKKTLSLRRPVLIAAIIATLLMLVGCGVIYMLSMNGMKLGDQTETRDVFEYDPNTGEAVAYVGKETYTEAVFTMAGLQGTPAYLAACDWFAFTQSYDPNREILGTVWGNEPEFSAEYGSYHIYTEEMREKIDEISQKYGLKLVGKRLDFQGVKNVCDALGIKRIQAGEHDIFLQFDDAKCWENGNFYLAFDIIFPEWAETELSDTWGTVYWNRKDCFSDDMITFEDTGDWTEWEYTTTSGHKAVITASPSHSRGYIICDRREAVMSIMVENLWSFRDDGEVTRLHLTDRQMEQIADTLDRAVDPRIPTQEDVDSQPLPTSEETQNGYTIKVKSAKTDGWMARIVLGITAPEGTVISRNPHEGFENIPYHIGFGNFELLPDRTRIEVGASGGWNVRDDNDGRDNTVDLVLERFAAMEDGTAPFGWGTSWDLWIEDIAGSYWVDSQHSFREDILTEAGWRFDFSFNERNGDYRTIEFAQEPFMLAAITGFEPDGTDILEDIEVTSFELHTMSAVIRHNYGSAVDFRNPMYVVMKDGSQIAFQTIGALPGGTFCTMENHVNIDEVDHILLPDGTKLASPKASS